jgi:hypothetical protein
VVLVSVGAVTSAQLKRLLRRIRSTFPRSQILVGYWDSAEQLKPHDVELVGNEFNTWARVDVPTPVVC